jgi:hypothetical protein
MTPMPTPPRRRWFQFSLATMFVVVTVLAVWLGWEVKLVRDRSDFLVWCHEGNVAAGLERGWTAYPSRNVPAPAIPFWRRWLGDESVHAITLPPGSSAADYERATVLFPEAAISRD